MASNFAQRLIRWQKRHGRHDLPWQVVADAYRVWLSEIMLQQTRVATVIPYYRRFVASFPTIVALSAATEEQVLAHWSGLGYYARGRNLHKAAQIIVDRYGGEFPRQFEQILELPGIGRSTAAAICALAYNDHRAILRWERQARIGPLLRHQRVTQRKASGSAALAACRNPDTAARYCNLYTGTDGFGCNAVYAQQAEVHGMPGKQRLCCFSKRAGRRTAYPAITQSGIGAKGDLAHAVAR